MKINKIQVKLDNSNNKIIIDAINPIHIIQGVFDNIIKNREDISSICHIDHNRIITMFPILDFNSVNDFNINKEHLQFGLNNNIEIRLFSEVKASNNIAYDYRAIIELKIYNLESVKPENYQIGIVDLNNKQNYCSIHDFVKMIIMTYKFNSHAASYLSYTYLYRGNDLDILMLKYNKPDEGIRIAICTKNLFDETGWGLWEV